MAAFKNLFGMKEKVTFPIRHECIPDQLSVTIDLVNLETPSGPLQCWKYVTDGFKALGQKEMVFLLVREKEEAAEAFPEQPLVMFTNFEPVMRQGEVYDVGSVPDFGGPGPFGRQLTFLPARSVPGVEIPQDALVPYLIDLSEHNSVQDFGITRFIARLGKSTGVFPYPIWSQRVRNFLPEKMDQETLLAKIDRAVVPQMFVYQEGDAFYLINNPEQVGYLRDTLPALSPIALLTGPDKSADAMLVWQYPQEDHAAHIQPGKEGDRLCGSFLLIIPEQEENRWEIYEDGFCWMVNRRTWESIRKVLLAGRSVKATMVETALTFAMI